MSEINIDGIIGWDIEASDFRKDLSEMSGDVYLNMNTPGGLITEGVSMMNAIKEYNKGKVIANVSLAASMGTQITSVCDEVRITNNSVFMIHNAQGFAGGDHNDLRKRANILESMTKMLAKNYTKKTKKSDEEIRKMMDDETYLFGEEILQHGFADTMSESDAESNKDEMIALATASFENCVETLNASKKKESTAQMAALLKDENMGGTAETIPSENVKLVNLNKGENMEFNEENFKNLSEQNKVLKANRETMSTRFETATAKIETLSAELDTKKEEIEAMKAEMENKLSESNEAKEQAIKDRTLSAVAVIKEAFASGVNSEETIVAMVNAKTPEDASAIAISSKENQPAINQMDDNSQNTESALKRYANQNKGTLR